MSKLFFAGVPTKFDVDKLIKAITPEPGMRISYASVAEVIGVEPKTSRWRTVTDAWRARMFKEKNLRMTAEGGEFVVLTAAGALSKGIDDFHKVGRALGRTGTRVAVINEGDLDVEGGAQKRIVQREILAVTDAARKAAKEIAMPSAHTPIARLVAKS